MLRKLDKKSVKINKLNRNRRLRKYVRDGISPRKSAQTVTQERHEVKFKSMAL